MSPAEDASAILSSLPSGLSSPLHTVGRPSYDVTSTLVDAGERVGPADRVVSSLDALLIINFVANRSYHKNPALRQDVNGNGVVTALDALLVINYINANTINGVTLPPPLTNVAFQPQIYRDFGYPINLYWDLKPLPNQSPPIFLDVNGNGEITSADANDVISKLNNPSLP